MKIYIGIPTYDRKIDMEILAMFGKLIGETNHSYALDFIAGSTVNIGTSRNYLVRRFLETDFDYLYFWDADLVIRDSTFLDKLLETSKALDAPIVGGIYRIKDTKGEYACGVHHPETNSIDNLKVGEIPDPRIVDTLATGSMLIHKDVFSKISDPWFETIDKAEGVFIPEDYHFCLKAKSKGILTAVDPRFETFHFGFQSWDHIPTNINK